jgi:hypothetical protein
LEIRNIEKYPLSEKGNEEWDKYVREKTIVKKIEIQDKVDALWQYLKESYEKKCLMGCSAEGDGYLEHAVTGEDTGLLAGHAYAIVDILEIEYLPNTLAKKK